GDVGDRPAVRQGDDAGGPPSAQDPMDPVVVEERAVAAEARGGTLGEVLDDLVEGLTRQPLVGGGPADEGVQLVGAPGAAGALGGDLLREDVERRLGRTDAVELAGGHGANEGGALDQLVPRRGEEPSA